MFVFPLIKNNKYCCTKILSIFLLISPLFSCDSFKKPLKINSNISSEKSTIVINKIDFGNPVSVLRERIVKQTLINELSNYYQVYNKIDKDAIFTISLYVSSGFQSVNYQLILDDSKKQFFEANKCIKCDNAELSDTLRQSIYNLLKKSKQNIAFKKPLFRYNSLIEKALEAKDYSVAKIRKNSISVRNIIDDLLYEKKSNEDKLIKETNFSLILTGGFYKSAEILYTNRALTFFYIPFGIGIGNLSYLRESNEISYELESNQLLLSYKLYDIFSYIVEYGYPFMGKGKAVSTGKNLNTTGLSGYSLKGFIGYAYKDFELMVGINSFKKKFNDFYDSGRRNYLNEYEIKGYLISGGIAYNF